LKPTISAFRDSWIEIVTSTVVAIKGTKVSSNGHIQHTRGKEQPPPHKGGGLGFEPRALSNGPRSKGGKLLGTFFSPSCFGCEGFGIGSGGLIVSSSHLTGAFMLY